MAANMILVLVVVFAFPAATAVFQFSESISLENEPLRGGPSEVARDIQKVSRRLGLPRECACSLSGCPEN